MMKKSKRECDVHVEGHELVKAFVQHCNNCERGCPMGCIRRRGDVQGLLTSDSWKCGSVLQCFAGFALSRHVEGKETMDDV